LYINLNPDVNLIHAQELFITLFQMMLTADIKANHVTVLVLQFQD